ncbi:carbon-nitrogen hydrolase family protein [Rudanella paleaurantiibacter]|uniref:Carbon-nitrogen hydrolase family protein n=1 Tax=Rudanella paleaurantiibacter TaxID=2614655 RepID=A0A7J5U4M8_9BACT|nr:carbon-nitrogen hydrolase family protein [Rudanella paleaurantiibacter]KAB7732789.1 carbon-nitrogen hydrolase family protein [Rudanella paleaurantiibacter]
MKIGIAQLSPLRGDVAYNLQVHQSLTEQAVAAGVSALFFPELSLTGYEPELAHLLATSPQDSLFDPLQTLSDRGQITLGVGMPLRTGAGVQIGMILLSPGEPRQVYAKQYLHPDEYPYFVAGTEPGLLNVQGTNIALAICYELSIPGHPQRAYQDGANLYVASVAKSAEGAEKAAMALSAIANAYAMPVLMANSVGPCDNFVAAGQSGVWNAEGTLLAQLDTTTEGILIYDTQSETAYANKNP